MRSSPPVQLALVVIGFLVLAWPLLQLTSRPAASAPVAVQQPVASSTRCLLRVSTAHAPEKLSLSLGQQVLLSQVEPGGLTEIEVQLPLVKDGLELTVVASWPAGTPRTALTVELEPDGLDALSLTRWADAAEMNEVLPFIWPEQQHPQ